jgi:hypothetical protein
MGGTGTGTHYSIDLQAPSGNTMDRFDQAAELLVRTPALT